jgi:hypothetical protein
LRLGSVAGKASYPLPTVVTVSDVDDQPETVRCPRCKGRRDPSAFISPAGARSKTCQFCRDRSRRENRERRDRIGVEGVRAENLRTKYGISVAEYDALRVKQNFRCAICLTHEDEIPPAPSGRPRLDGKPTAEAFRLVVDHCHNSRRVRGLLCAGCNAAIGQFRDNGLVLLAALEYLGLADQLESYLQSRKIP